MADLKIHKKYLDNVEQYTRFGSGGRYDRYAVRYIFNMPEDSEYKDYAFYLDTTDCKFEDGELIKESVGRNYEKKGSYYHISVEDSKKIKLFRYKNREESKRYKRYELDTTELNSILNYNKAIKILPYDKSFVEACLNADATLFDLYDYIEYWHTHETGNTLQEFLGLTDYEYEQWGKSSDIIFKNIIRCRQEGIEFSEYGLLSESERMAARSYDQEDIEKMKNSKKYDYAVANVVKYLNNNSRDAGAVVSTEFKIGRTDGTWFYVDDERRKVNSKGINILGKIEPKNVDKVETVIRNYYSERRKVELEIEEQKNERYLLGVIMDKVDGLKSEDAKKQIAEICNNRKKEIIDAGIEICTRLSDMEARFYQTIHFLTAPLPTENSSVTKAQRIL